MNPAAPLDPVGGAQGVLATVQALQALLAGLAEPTPAADAAGETEMAQATTAPQPGQATGAPQDTTGVMLAGDTQALAAAAQAQQGRATLGQLAGDAAAPGRDTVPPAAPVHAGTAVHDSTLLPETLAVPVLLTALQPPSTPPLPTWRAPPEAPPRRQRDGDGQPQQDPSHEQAHDQAHDQAQDDRDDAHDDPRGGTDAVATLQQLDAAGAWHQRLRRAGQSEVLAELDRGRHVLLVQPQPGGAAQALLLSLRGLHGFAAQCALLAAGAPWSRWRVFRDGDPLHSRGLRSRSGGGGCLLRLGPPRPQLSVSGSDMACVLQLPDRLRFAQALGGQWSLLLVLAPGDVA
ncbi:hypothetical protein ACPOLB_15125 [Rubrivivax sp. RP6-9]|uniref:hypothetical protein n=1 Tax=Rubrivivax sp. RP6-9 TaxID=3415750 RepID=UPI003CC5CE1D